MRNHIIYSVPFPKRNYGIKNKNKWKRPREKYYLEGISFIVGLLPQFHSEGVPNIEFGWRKKLFKWPIMLAFIKFPIYKEW